MLLAILVLAIYWQSQHHEFIDYDDQLYVTKNYRIQSEVSLKSMAGVFREVHPGHGHWHPMTMLTHMMDWHLFGYNAGGHHWTNVIIHAFNAILLFLLWWMMTGAIGSSVFVAALFAIHPINVESVAWIAERKNVLSGFFWLLTMICYVWYVRSPGWKRYLPVLICFVLGLMSKSMLVTLPFVLLLIDYWPLKRTLIGPDGQSIVSGTVRTTPAVLLMEKVPLFVVTAVFAGVAIYAAHTGNAYVSPDSAPISARITNAIVSYVLYLKKFFWPTDLSVFYVRSAIPIWETSLAVTILISATVLACKYAAKYPYLIVGWFWYLGTLIPVIGLIQVGDQAMADRYAYIPCIGIFMIVAWFVPQALSKLRHAKTYAYSIFIVLILIYAIMAHAQLGMWKNTKTLFGDAIKVDPENYTAYNILGSDEAGKGNHDEAMRYYHRALKINPKFARAYSNAGNSLLALGRYGEANDYYQKAIAINDRLDIAHYNLGVLKLTTDRPFDAVTHFNKVLSINPGYFNAHFNLGVAFLKTGNIGNASVHFEKAVELNPISVDARKGLMICREMQKGMPVSSK